MLSVAHTTQPTKQASEGMSGSWCMSYLGTILSPSSLPASRPSIFTAKRNQEADT